MFEGVAKNKLNINQVIDALTSVSKTSDVCRIGNYQIPTIECFGLKKNR